MGGESRCKRSLAYSVEFAPHFFHTTPIILFPLLDRTILGLLVFILVPPRSKYIFRSDRSSGKEGGLYASLAPWAVVVYLFMMII